MADEIERIAKLGMSQPLALTPAQIQQICGVLLSLRPPRQPQAGVFLVLVKGRMVAEVPADSRRDALQGWLQTNDYGTLEAASVALKCHPSEIEVMDKP